MVFSIAAVADDTQTNMRREPNLKLTWQWPILDVMNE